MKKLQATTLLLIAMVTIALAQSKKFNETKVSKFETDTILTTYDMGFLALIIGADASKNRGDAVKEAKLGGKVFKEGQQLTAEDVEVIRKAIKSYKNANKETVTAEPQQKPLKVRGCEYYCYYYYWCNATGRYDYYYYCC